MKHVLPYALFEASAAAPAALTQEQIDWLDKCSFLSTWKLNPQTGLVDINGVFYSHEQGLTDLKGVKFGNVSGDFVCSYNQLTSLEGAPQSVGGGFQCNKNQLTSLDGAPQTVGGTFYCYDNELTSLEGAPRSVGGDFHCGDNQLTSLVGAPQSVGGNFRCEANELTSLVGAPQRVDGSFECSDNQLTSLEGAPQIIKKSFNCDGNPISSGTLKAIFALMKKRKPYQQALEEHWPEMSNEDRALMYKEMTNLSPEDVRKYKALATYNNIKNYL